MAATTRSRFLEIQCGGCGNHQKVYGHATMKVKCLVCGEQLTRPTGSRVDLTKGKGKVVKVL